MITQNTLFILGAGASCPYYYPSGKELRRRICFEFIDNYKNYILKNQDDSNDAFLKHLLNFKGRFYHSSNKSIDLFLSRNPKLVELGKFAIGLEILKAEIESNFRERSKHPEQDWYSYLYDRLTDTFIDKDTFTISDNNISFITFNYDRSLEYILFDSLKNSFEGLRGTDVATELKNIPLIHVFGKIIPLPWEGASLLLDYASEINEYTIGLIQGNIKIMSEELEDSVRVQTRELIENADRIFFLGFGYARENLQLLDFPNILKDGQKIFGTSLGLTPREILERKKDYFYPGTNSTNVYIEEKLDSLMLLKEYL